MEEIRLGASGLWTDPSELQAPPGALREALNVRIRRPNVIEPRPGFPYESISGAPGTVRHMLEWAGGLLVIAGTELWHVVNGGAVTEVTDPDGASLSITAADSCLVEVADGVMVPTDTGVFYVDASLNATRAGIEKPATYHTLETTGPTLANGDSFAFRALIIRQLANGRLVIGEASDRYEVSNSTGGTIQPHLAVALPPGTVAGDVLQVYVSDVSSGTPDDEMTMADAFILDSADVAAGYFTTSVWTYSAGQPALYVNETQGGVLQNNTPPPRARRVAWYNQMAFYADERQRYAIGVPRTETADDIAYQDPIGTTKSVTTTLSSTTVSATSLRDNMVGMYLSEGDAAAAGTYFSAYTKVVSVNVGANTFVVDKPALAAGTFSATIHTVYRIDGIDFIEGGSATNPAERTWVGFPELAQALAIHSDVDLVDEDAETLYDDVFGDRYFLSDSAFTLEVFTWPTTWILLGFGIDYTSGEVTATLDTRTRRNRLSWSKTLQPEAVPFPNHIDIGSASEPILGLATTRDSLFVFKADGVWRVTGSDPDTLRVDEFDRSLKIIHPLALATYGNDVWAWCTRGMMRVNEGGAEDMSGTAIRDLIEPSQRNVHGLAAAGTYVGGCFVGACETDGVIAFGVPAVDASGADDEAEYLYIYEARTRAWVRWQHAGTAATDRICAFGSEAGTMVLGSGRTASAAGGLMRANADLYDKTDTTTISTFTASVDGPDGVTYPGSVSGSTGFERCLLIDDEDAEAWVLYSVGVDEPIVSAALSTTATNGATRRSPVECRVEWVALAAGNPAQLVHWRSVQALFGDCEAMPGPTLLFSSERRPQWESIRLYTFSDPLRPEPAQLRGHVTRSHARSKRLRVRFVSEWAHQKWRLEGLALTFEPMRGGERTP